MRIALLISGRAVCYESCLLPLLQGENSHIIDIFMSINDDESNPYFDKMKTVLAPWLKDCMIAPYEIPDSFDYSHELKLAFKTINGKELPYNQLSMFYNDTKAFELATTYAKKNNVEYDYFMKFRADIQTPSLPDLKPPKKLKLQLYSIQPNCSFVSYGLVKKNVISDAWVWGNYETMSHYCNTYKFILNMLKVNRGYYPIHYESCVTDAIYSNYIPVTFVKQPYTLDENRKGEHSLPETLSVAKPTEVKPAAKPAEVKPTVNPPVKPAVNPPVKPIANPPAAKPVEVKPAEVKPAEVKPAEVKPAEVKPAEVKPAEVKPAEVKPVEVKPVEVKPVEVKPVEVKPVEVKPVEVKPVEVKPVEVKPVEVKPVEVKPAEVKPTSK